MKHWYAAALAVSLLACNSGGLDGTYADENGIASYTFRPGGKVALTTMGTETEMNYKVEDGKVKIGSAAGPLVMTILDDGSIQGPMGVKLTKQGE